MNISEIQSLPESLLTSGVLKQSDTHHMEMNRQ